MQNLQGDNILSFSHLCEGWREKEKKIKHVFLSDFLGAVVNLSLRYLFRHQKMDPFEFSTSKHIPEK